MVLSAWKKDLEEERHDRRWGRFMTASDFYHLANHVIDKLVLPACKVFMGCHPDDPKVPMCWAVTRGADILHLYARKRIRQDDPELGAAVQRVLLSEIETSLGRAPEIRPLHPFQELSR